MSDTILVLQHAAPETLGALGPALTARQILPRYVKAFAGERIPRDPGRAAGLIVLGGPMGVADQARYPFLRQEIALIERTLAADRPVLGICLGSQLLAAALGARVGSAPRPEIGWYPVRLTEAAAADPVWTSLPPSFTAFHWHGDVFDLPRGSVLLGSSDRTPHQAFRYGAMAWGLQFHPEVTSTQLAAMADESADDLYAAGVNRAELVAAGARYLPALQRVGRLLIDDWLAVVRQPALCLRTP